MQCQTARNLTTFLNTQISGEFWQSVNHPRKTVLAWSCTIGLQDGKEVDLNRGKLETHKEIYG